MWRVALILMAGLRAGPSAPPADPAAPFQPRPGDHPVTAQVFYSADCAHCVAAIEQVIKPLERHFGQWVTFDLRETTQADNFAEQDRLIHAYGVQGVPYAEVFVGAHAVPAEDRDRLCQVLLAELQRPSQPPLRARLAPGEAAAAAPPRLSAGVALTTLAVGTVDGLNPCAFATVVFLIAMLTRLGADRRTLVSVGVAYTIAVYVTYLLLGLGVLHALAWFGDRLKLANLLRVGVAYLALGFAWLQLWDVAKLKSGGATRELKAQMPLKVKQAVHLVLRHGLNRPAAVLGATVAGCLVTLLEMVCTSQVYIPILIGLRSPALRGRAVPLLAVYNLGFVLPLVAVIVLAYRGLSSERLGQWARRHLVAMKLLLAVFLGALALWLLSPELVGH
jgi:cytochrome c biogenesis protein CcdA